MTWRVRAMTLLLMTVLGCAGMRGEAAMEQARRADDLVDSMGVATHFGYLDTVYGKFDAIIAPRLIELGIRHIRDGGPRPTDAVMVGKYQELAKHGITACLIYSGDRPMEENLQSIKALGKAIDLIEGPNETDNTGYTYQGKKFPESTRLFMEELYTAVKADPATKHLPVVMASMSFPDNGPKLGLVDAADYACSHSYSDGSGPLFRLDDWYIPRAKLNADKPLIVTETGYHNAINKTGGLWIPGVSEAASGKYLPRVFLEYFNRGIVRTYIYEFIDEDLPGRETTDPERNFGMLHTDGTPKPSYTALKRMIALLQDPGDAFTPAALDITLDGALTNVHHTLLQKRDGRFYLILWIEKPSFDTKGKKDIDIPAQSVTITTATPIAQASIYQPYVSEKAIDTLTAPVKITVSVPDHPVIIELTCKK